MANNETPLFFGDGKKEQENDDIFKSVTEVPIKDDLDEKIEDSDPQDLFGQEINLSNNEEDHVPSIQPTATPTTNGPREEESDVYNIEITVTEPEKRGDGMSSYIVYKVVTRTTIPQFRRPESSVFRRFSDFLGLHEKLAERHQAKGIIVPPPPEKDVVGTTKLKISKDDTHGEFIEKRRACLERYLNRLARNKTLILDDNFRDFLEREGDLPKSSSTSALSGAGLARLFNKVGDSIGKITFKMDETDQWFEEKQQQIETLDAQLRRLHSAIEGLVAHRKELAICSKSVSSSVTLLSSIEEHGGLSRALNHLADVEEKMHNVHLDQADADFFSLAELIKDYIGLVGAVKEAMNQRVKTFKSVKDAESALTKRREAKVKAEIARKNDKVQQEEAAIQECEYKLEKAKKDFEDISGTIRKEIARFEKQRVKDFKSTVINYLQALMSSQQEVNIK